MTIDLNADVGEGVGDDAELMPWITSANIACGAHAGDDGTMRAAVELACAHGVAIGAHPGFADPVHFGRREQAITPAEASELVVRQVRRLEGIARAAGARVSHVKLHGALYNQAARDADLAGAILAGLWSGPDRPAVVTLAGSVMERVARALGAGSVVAEAFADRRYEPDGSLTPRSLPDAVIADEEAALEQVLRLVREAVVRTRDGAELRLRAGTICLHGDGLRAVPLARLLRKELAAAGVVVRAFGL
jgi:UPF0271 protein